MYRLSTILLLILAVAANSSCHGVAAETSPPQDDTAPRTTEISTKEFSVVILIVGDKPTISFARQTIGNLFGPRPYWIAFKPPVAPIEKSIVGVLTLQYPENEDPQKHLAAAQKRLQALLLEIHKANMEPFDHRMRQALERREEAREFVSQLGNEVRLCRERLMQANVFPGGLDKQLGRLKEERLTLRVEMAGLEARYEGIVKHIHERDQKLQRAEEKQGEDLRELEKIVRLRQEQLARIHKLVAENAVSESEVGEIEIQLSTARAELAERRRQIAQAAGSAQLDRLNQQLVDVQIEMRAAEAQLRVIDEALAQLGSGGVRKLVEDYDRASRQLERALAEEELVAAELAEIKSARHAISPPQITVIGRANVIQ